MSAPDQLPPDVPPPTDNSRREFLQQLALLGAAVSAFRCRSPEPEPAPLDLRPLVPPQPSPPFTAAQLAALAAAFARILPGEEGFPGAADAGVIDFAASELRRPELGEIRKRIVSGLLALDRRAGRAVPGKIFATLSPPEQDQILSATQTGSLQGEQFLRILISITLEGFLGDPAYGGNRDGVGWQLTGAAPTSERGRLPDSLAARAAAHAREVGASGPTTGSKLPIAPNAAEAAR